MSIPGSATFLTLLAVISLQQALLLLAAPAIENAAYTSQDLLADESAPATWTAALRRQRRHDVHGPELYGRHGWHWPGRGHGLGHDFGYGFGYDSGYNSGYGSGFGAGPGFGHGHGHGYGPGYSRSFGFGFPAYGHGYNLPEPHYKVPLAPFKDNRQGSSREPSSSSFAPPSSKTTAAPATRASTTTPTTTTTSTTTTTEDSVLAIDLRSGLS